MSADQNAVPLRRDTSDDVQIPVQEMVGIEILPIGTSIDWCEGGIVRLVKGSGDQEISLAAGMSGPQLREIARQLLTIADASSKGAEKTVMCVSSPPMWKLPGQVLLVRCEPSGRPHFEFMVKPQAPGAGKKLVMPPKLVRP